MCERNVKRAKLVLLAAQTHDSPEVLPLPSLHGGLSDVAICGSPALCAEIASDR